MARRPLLAELHAHTTWSDGVLNPGELVDLYGSAGFDVLAITDHVVRSESPATFGPRRTGRTSPQIDAEAERARKRYGMLVLPGLELTVEEPRPRSSRATQSQSGCAEFVSVDGGLEAALGEARDLGAALIAVAPVLAGVRLRVASAEPPGSPRTRSGLSRWSTDSSSSTARSASTGSPSGELPFVATGDFHVPEHLFTWKTLLTCERTEGAVVERLRSSAPCALMRIGTARVAA